MNMATQLDGERIVKQVSDELSAREILAERGRPLRSWHYAGVLVLGATWGFLVATQVGSNALTMIGVAAGVGLFAGAAALRQYMQLRRRLDAALVLLQAQGR